MTITSPKYSFVQFNTGLDAVLPVAGNSDLAFQLVFDGTKNEADIMMSASIELHAVDYEAVITDDASLTANSLISYPDYFSLYRISATRVLLYSSTDLLGIAGIDARCFRLVFKYGTEFYTSNIFGIIADDKYTSVLQYYGDENSNGFYYCTIDFENKVRLPLYISRPQFEDEENVYVRSNGSIDVLSSTTKKEYQGETEYFNQSDHEKLKIALSSDNVIISSFYYTGGIRKNGGYEIEWPERFEDGDIELGKGKFKVYVTPYNVRNSNCQECENEWVDPCAPSNITWESVNNGDGTQTITFTFSPGPDAAQLSIFKSTDNSTYSSAGVLGAPNESPVLITIALGIYYIKFSAFNGCVGNTIISNVGII